MNKAKRLLFNSLIPISFLFFHIITKEQLEQVAQTSANLSSSDHVFS